MWHCRDPRWFRILASERPWFFLMRFSVWFNGLWVKNTRCTKNNCLVKGCKRKNRPSHLWSLRVFFLTQSPMLFRVFDFERLRKTLQSTPKYLRPMDFSFSTAFNLDFLVKTGSTALPLMSFQLHQSRPASRNNHYLGCIRERTKNKI